jgi:hypothetical protein
VIVQPSRIIRWLDIPQEVYEALVNAAGLSVDTDVEKMVEEARNMLEAHADRSWIPWAGKRFMPTLARKLRQKEADKAAAERERVANKHKEGLRRQAGEKRASKVERRAARENEAQAKREVLHASYKAKTISPQALVMRMREIDNQLEAANKADESDGEEEVADDDNDDEDEDEAAMLLRMIRVPAGITKRKRVESSEEEGPTKSGKVCRCSYSFHITEHRYDSAIAARVWPTARPA